MKNKKRTTWDDLRREIFSPEDMLECDIRVALASEIIKARKEQGVTQKELESKTGIRQPAIARLESGSVDPQLSTIIKILAPLGKTIAIVPLESSDSASV